MPPCSRALRARAARPLRRLAHEESGFTLVELLTTASLLIVVLLAVLALADTSQQIAPKESERAFVIRETQAGLDRMTRELRHSYSLAVTGPDSMEAQVVIQGQDRRVKYDCATVHPTISGYRQCVRTVVGSAASEVVVDRILNTRPVFSYVTTAGRVSYVRAVVEVAAKGDRKQGYEHRVVLDDGFYMRNQNLDS